VTNSNAFCTAIKLATATLVITFALQLGGRCWAAADFATVPFEQMVQKLQSYSMDTSSASAKTVMPAPPVITEEAAPEEVSEYGPADGCAPSLANEGFFSRFADTYSDLLHNYFKDHANLPAYWANEGQPVAAPSDQPPAYRGAPPPMDEPPFAYSTFPIGATETIGYQGGYNTSYASPLMNTIWCGPYGKLIKDSRVEVFGWLNPGFNASTSNSEFRVGHPSGGNHLIGAGGNGLTAYDVYPNTIQLDQLTFYIQREADEVQTDHFDWGFRIANLFGQDYKYTFTHDILSDQYITAHNKYGYDPVMVYADFYFPWVAQGMNLRIGRYISIPDIEAQLAPDNLMASHSDVYSPDPYTQTGIVDTIRWNENWTTQIEFSGGNDVAPWDTKNIKPTPAFCVQWTSNTGNDVIYPCVNGVNDGKYAYNNLQHDVLTWYHKFAGTQWNMATETYYMWERKVPNVNNPKAAPLLIQNANGAACSGGPAGPLTCTAPEYGIVNYLNYQFRPNAFLSLRNEFYDDYKGQRFGFPTAYSENTVGVTWFVGSVIAIRPEARFDYGYQVPAFDGGRKWGQFTFDTDAIFFY
jgi:Putative beta-barrel porin-2, OmpL-like. bbp2